jgi:cation-transporting P-type ATPase 13A2
VTSLSNSHSQKVFIHVQAQRLGLRNLTVVTGDVKDYHFGPQRYLPPTVDGINLSFDRVLSIEMFEHMKNHEFLLKKIATWLKPSGKLFVHIFCHKSDPYDMERGTPRHRVRG